VGDVEGLARRAVGLAETLEKAVRGIRCIGGGLVVKTYDDWNALLLDLANHVRVLAEEGPTGPEATLSADAGRIAGHAPDAQRLALLRGFLPCLVEVVHPGDFRPPCLASARANLSVQALELRGCALLTRASPRKGSHDDHAPNR